MGNNITDRLKYKESVLKFSKKYGVAKAAYKFGECKRTIYRWKNRYDGTLGSIMDKITSSRIYKNNTRIVSCNAKIRNIQKNTKQKERK